MPTNYFERFSRIIICCGFVVQIYSVVNGKIRCEITIKHQRERGDEVEINVNSQLIQKGMAEPAEESFLSKVWTIIRNFWWSRDKSDLSL